MGAQSIRVDKPADLRPALDQAPFAGRPVVLDVHTDIEGVAPFPSAVQGHCRSRLVRANMHR